MNSLPYHTRLNFPHLPDYIRFLSLTRRLQGLFQVQLDVYPTGNVCQRSSSLPIYTHHPRTMIPSLTYQTFRFEGAHATLAHYSFSNLPVYAKLVNSFSSLPLYRTGFQSTLVTLALG